MRLLVVDSVDNIEFFCSLLFVYFVVNFCLSLPPLNRLKYYQNVVCVLLSTYVTHTTDIFFTFPPAGPQTKGLVKSLDFPTQYTPG
jgi:hypothetical protein